MRKLVVLVVLVGWLLVGGCGTTQKEVNSRHPPAGEAGKPVDNKPPSEIYNLQSKISELIKPARGGSDADQINNLIRQLGDDNWQTREKAQEELIKIGEPAEELLRKALEDNEPERRQRVKHIIHTIEWKDVKVDLDEVKSWCEKLDLIFIGEIKDPGKPQFDCWSGELLNTQRVIYKIETILKGEWKYTTVVVTFPIVQGAKHSDSVPRLDPNIFKQGNRHIVFAKQSVPPNFIGNSNWGVEKPVKGLISKVKRYLEK